MEIRCPYCEKTVQVPGGGQFTCPSCRAVFAVDLDPQRTPPATGPGPGSPPPLPDTGGPAKPTYAPPPMPPVQGGPVCARHPGISAGEVCKRCGNFMCVSCAQTYTDGQRYCSDCANAFAGGQYQAGGVIPWEHERAQKGTLGSYWETMKLCFKEPERFWRTLNPDGEMGQAVWYNVLGNSLFQIPMMLIMALFVFFFFSLMIAGLPPAQRGQVAAMGGIYAGFLAVGAILLPLTTAMNLFIGSAIYHLVAAIVGCQRGYATTLRIIGYSLGTFAAPMAAATLIGLVLQFIPCLGGLVNMAIQLGLAGWMLAVQYHGFKIQHNLTQGRALLCVLWPFIFACCACGGLFALVFSMAAAGGAAGGGGRGF